MATVANMSLKVNWCCFKPCRFLFHLVHLVKLLVNFPGVKFSTTIQNHLAFTYKRESRTFHVAVVQCRQRTVNLLMFLSSRHRRRRRLRCIFSPLSTFSLGITSARLHSVYTRSASVVEGIKHCFC